MKMIVIGIACAMVMACTDEQNLGNTYTLRAARWTVPLPGMNEASFVTPYEVAIDPSGDVLVDGAFEGAVDFGGGEVTTAPEQLAHWIGKRSGADGSYLWTKVLGGAALANFSLDGMRVDAQGNAIIAGALSGTQQIAGRTISSGPAAYVAKLSPVGDLLWIRTLETNPSYLNVFGLAVGADGRIYFTGEFQGTVHFPNGDLVGGPGLNFYLAALEPDGTVRWGRQVPVGRLAAASDGSIILAGAVDASTTFGGVNIDLSEDPAQFAAEITADGDVAWVRPFGEAGVPYQHVLLALDDQDHIATTSSIGNDGALTSGTDDVFLDASGHSLWTSSPVSGHISEDAIATNGHAILTAGRLNDWTVDLGKGPEVGSMYVAARDASGDLVDTKVLGDPGKGDGFSSLATSNDGAVAFTAAIGEPIDFGNGTVPGPTRGHDSVAVVGLFAP